MEINWKVTTAPAAEPMTTAEAKKHLRVDTDADDTLISSQIAAARQWAEDYERRAYITQTITAKLDRFCNEIVLPMPRLISVTSIKYIDTAGAQQTLSADVYDVDVYREPGRVTLAYGQFWPAIRGDINGVEIIYTAGYGAASTDMPNKTIVAIKLLLAHLYENRETVSPTTLVEVPMGAKVFLNARVWT